MALKVLSVFTRQQSPFSGGGEKGILLGDYSPPSKNISGENEIPEIYNHFRAEELLATLDGNPFTAGFFGSCDLRDGVGGRPNRGKKVG